MSRCIIALVLILCSCAASAEITGRARVIDGDTLEVAGQHIRLHGIDSPEIQQSCYRDGKPWGCGEAATKALAGKIGSRVITCQERDWDRYGRIVAVCYADGEGLNAWMVRQGWALAYQRYSIDYVLHEAKARTARKGIWQGDFMPPWDWRKMVRNAK